MIRSHRNCQSVFLSYHFESCTGPNLVSWTNWFAEPLAAIWFWRHQNTFSV